jgi:hypothetical protein
MRLQDLPTELRLQIWTECLKNIPTQTYNACPSQERCANSKQKRPMLGVMPLSLTNRQTSAEVMQVLACLDIGYRIRCCSPSCLLEVVLELSPEHLARTRIFDFDLGGTRTVPMEAVPSVTIHILDTLCKADQRYFSSQTRSPNGTGDKWEARMETDHATRTPSRVLAFHRCSG